MIHPVPTVNGAPILDIELATAMKHKSDLPPPGRTCLYCERTFTPSRGQMYVDLACQSIMRAAIKRLLARRLIYDVAPLLKRLQKIGAIHVPECEVV